MKFYEDLVLQARKHEHLVPGDYYLCERKPDATTVLLLDGVGSGVYANIAAIACGSRLMELMDGGRSLQAACGHVAESMHRARTEEIPFAAFVALRIQSNGQFTCYAYENPGPVLIHDHTATACPQRFIALKYEMIAESTGTLSEGDRLLLMSDGVTHAGMGGGYATGWGTEGVVGEINAYLRAGRDALKLPGHLLHMAYTLSGKVYWDDTSLAMVTCRPAKALTLLTGPPASRADDARAVRLFLESPGKKVICGSTTTEIASRELKRPAKMASMDISPGSPPEYIMEGIDLITEGAVTLNQAMNLLEESDEIDFSQSDSPVFKLCALLLEADAIAFLVGGGYNQGHDDPLFQQLGVKPRRRVVRRLAEFLKAKGKEVSVRRL